MSPPGRPKGEYRRSQPEGTPESAAGLPGDVGVGARARRHRSPAAQSGMAVLGALVVVIAAALTATALLERQSMLARILASERDRSQAQVLLRGAMNWSRFLLYWDARHSPHTLAGGLWAQPIVGMELSAPGDARQAVFSGLLEDEQGKFNLGGLAQGGAVVPEQVMALEKLMVLLALPPSLAQQLAQRVARGQAPPYRPGLRSISELQNLEELKPDIINRLRPYLTILPEMTTINVNTASAEVISAVVPALSLAEARLLVQQRERGLWFTSGGDFFNRIPREDVQDNQRFGTRSQWFRAVGQVRLDQASVGMEALLHRPGNTAPEVRWIKELH